MIPLHYFLITAAILFVMGVFTVIYKKNAIGVLMGVELMLNSVNLNFIAFSRYMDPNGGGMFTALFIIILAASEAAVALAIVLNLYRNRVTVDVTQVDEMKN